MIYSVIEGKDWDAHLVILNYHIYLNALLGPVPELKNSIFCLINCVAKTRHGLSKLYYLERTLSYFISKEYPNFSLSCVIFWDCSNLYASIFKEHWFVLE